MDQSLSFFSHPGLMTEPGRLAPWLATLPPDIPSLVRTVQGLMVHVFWADRYGLKLSEARAEEVQLRSVQETIDRLLELDSRPLEVARSLDKRVVGNCRHFAVLLTAFLRHVGVPARARCGFGTYFLAGHFEDHWACEYWDNGDGRWVLVDSQLDDLQKSTLGIDFDPLDVPRDSFVVAGRAWRMCRDREADPEAFGIHDMHGMWFIRGNLGRDVASLNKIELLPWDCWGIVDKDETALTPEDMASLDAMAALTMDAVPEFPEVREAFETDDRWSVPPVIRSYTQSGPQDVELAELRQRAQQQPARTLGWAAED